MTATYPRKRPVWPYAVFAALALCLLGTVIAVISASGQEVKRSPGAVWVSPSPSATAKNAKPTATPNPAAKLDRDIGAGTPGAFCASSRRGKQFVRAGVTYECKGPKPYRWRRAA